MSFHGGPRRRGPLLLAGVAGVAAALLSPVSASAHALVVRSNPAAGASLGIVPRVVTITFSEAPETGQSSIVVLDASGKIVSRGAALPAGSDRLTLAVGLEPLLNGIYTVRWKTVSVDDGHASAGSFTFGVGPAAYAASAGPAPALVSAPSTPSPLVIAGRWIFLAGLGLLIGGAWLLLFVLPGAARRLLPVTLGAALVMIAGLVVATLAQAVQDETPLAELPATSLGLAFLAQAAPGLAAAACIEVALWQGRRARAAALGLAIGFAAATLLAHVLTTHAASGRMAWFEVAAQWAHVAGFAAWIGGLAALLIALGSQPSPAKAAAVRRFSAVAAGSLGVVGVTGLLRALDEVAAWGAVLGTLFGQLVVVKVALLVVLSGLGAWNRFRIVPAIERGVGGLRRVGGIELGVAGVTLVVSAMLSSLVPPVQASATPKPVVPPEVTALGSAVGLRATLIAIPGYIGPNQFTLRVYDARTSHAVAGAVSLRFSVPAWPDVPESSLALARAADGGYGGLGANLSRIGSWQVTAQVQRAGEAVAIPFRLTVRPTPQELQQMTMGGLPMVHGLPLANGWQLMAYVTPGHQGRNTLHVQITDQRDGPVSVPDVPVVTARHGSVRLTVPMGRMAFGYPTPNQFLGVSMLTLGRWDFHMSLADAAAHPLSADFSLTVTK